ncbi:enoyl-CoA hydratase/isomerase family protein [Mycobacterium sp. EPa45]|uniref:enoyl-CoA hydratase/isomerase family protein n=1 Tax=Mycobacterium sp. EPa45 TaxID=1545728 RepID=UPI000641E646|nr:enoyl-CoA hydratase/isomerase family protein [Mycobacterium sp. EPa45]AKK26352.1 3-hydroxyisobutyryl-CoA hydrolase [Mycobacterium sp. EPa45]
MTAESDEVLTRVDGGVGFLTLNRPKAINSLTHNMVTIIAGALDQWADDDDVRAVVLAGAGERGLCAGGDVVAIYDSARADGGSEARRFWLDEYRLNAQIGSYPKPYVAIMDGIVMGGGVGVAAHGSVRVATDTSKIAMPEVGIGFVPDVGGTYLLSRAPGHLGLHAALSGAPFSGADAIALGFADHYVPQVQLEGLVAAIVEDGVDAAVKAFAIDPPPSQLLTQQYWIDECYAGDTVSAIIDALRGREEEDAKKAADLIASRSPIAASVALASVRRAARLNTLEDVLVQEYRVSSASLKSHDFVEGIRAQIVDKDRNPKWNPPSLAAVTEQDVEQYFAPADPDLTFEEDK